MKTCLLLLIALTGCGSRGIGTDPATCSNSEQQCAGTRLCYSGCYCRTGVHDRCLSACSLQGDEPLVAYPPPVAPANLDLARELVAYINELRRSPPSCDGSQPPEGLVDLEYDERLTLAAGRHATDMVGRGYFGHHSPEEANVVDRARAAGYRGCAGGENLARGHLEPKAVVTARLASPSHRENLIGSEYQAAGVAVTFDGETPLWVLTLGDQR